MSMLSVYTSVVSFFYSKTSKSQSISVWWDIILLLPSFGQLKNVSSTK